MTYRALAKPLADGTGVIVVAVPLGDLESTLRHLLWIELIVSALVLVGLGGPLVGHGAPGPPPPRVHDQRRPAPSPRAT